MTFMHDVIMALDTLEAESLTGLWTVIYIFFSILIRSSISKAFIGYIAPPSAKQPRRRRISIPRASSAVSAISVVNFFEFFQSSLCTLGRYPLF